MAIKIAIADDKCINRQTVIAKLFNYKEVEILFEAKDGKDFLEIDRKSTRLNSSHRNTSRMPSSA